jgi:transmembrane sensor
MNTSSELMRAAAHWFLRARAAKAESEEYTAWLAWMEADPEHRRAFAAIQETWDIARSAATQPSLETKRTESSSTLSRQSQQFAIAAAVLVAILGAAFGFDQWSKRSVVEERIATSRGEHRTTVLPDGSHVELGGLTNIGVKFTRDQRLIVADEGEAFYKVNRDPQRPFVVKTGGVLVTAIGTAFSVRREANIVSIAVDEGLVEVNLEGRSHGAKPVRARAGERIRIDSARPLATLGFVDSRSSGNWEPGKLRFEGEPLSVVIASLNRYSDREILLGDPTLATLQFSGTIFNDRIPQWLEGVQHLFPIELRSVDARHVVLERRKDATITASAP